MLRGVLEYLYFPRRRPFECYDWWTGQVEQFKSTNWHGAPCRNQLWPHGRDLYHFRLFWDVEVRDR